MLCLFQHSAWFGWQPDSSVTMETIYTSLASQGHFSPLLQDETINTINTTCFTEADSRVNNSEFPKYGQWSIIPDAQNPHEFHKRKRCHLVLGTNAFILYWTGNRIPG